MARASVVRRVIREDDRLARANRLAAEVIRIVGLIKIVAGLPDGRMRRELKAEVDRQIAALKEVAV